MVNNQSGPGRGGSEGMASRETGNARAWDWGSDPGQTGGPAWESQANLEEAVTACTRNPGERSAGSRTSSIPTMGVAPQSAEAAWRQRCALMAPMPARLPPEERIQLVPPLQNEPGNSGTDRPDTNPLSSAAAPPTLGLRVLDTGLLTVHQRVALLGEHCLTSHHPDGPIAADGRYYGGAIPREWTFMGDSERNEVAAGSGDGLRVSPDAWASLGDARGRLQMRG